MRKYSLTEFIETLLIPDLEKMVAAHLHYYAFSLICQGIEVLGAAYDGKELEEHGQSEARFRNALSNFFKDIRYRNNQAKFFKVLRGPLIHQLRPGEGLVLASETKDNIDPKHHLDDNGAGATLLIIEPFLLDFKEAFQRFKRHLSQNRAPSPEPFTSTFINVFEQNREFGKTVYNAALSSSITLMPYATGGAIIPPRFPDSGD